MNKTEPFKPSDDYMIAFHKGMAALYEQGKRTKAAIRILRRAKRG